MKKTLRYLLLVAIVCFSALSCTNPLKDIEVIVDADVINYSAVLELRDVSGAAIPNNLTVSVSGPDADAIYDLGGFKKLSIVDGMISVGIDHRKEPVAGKPLKFNITVSGANYLPVTVPFTVAKDDVSQIKSANLVNINDVPAGVAVKTATCSVAGGVITAPLTLSTSAEPGEPEVTTLNIPSGTQFKNAAGNVISSGTLSVSIVQFDYEQPSSMGFFPGGSYTSEVFTNASNVDGYGSFIPAGFSDISMSIDGVPVKTFNQPVSISVVIDPDYVMDNTNAAVKAGDVMQVSSYDNATAKWKIENDGTVNTSNGKLVLDFTTTHLSWFSWGRRYWYPYPPTPPYTYLNVSANNSTSLPVRVEVGYAGINYNIVNFNAVITPNMQQLFYLGYLNGGTSYKYTITSLTTNQVIGSGTFTGGTTNNINLVIPPPANPIVSMTLTVKCPGKQVVLTPPDFYLYYRQSNSTDPSFKLLGLVKGGKFSTSELKTNIQYDFKAVWGSKTKIVNRKTVTLNNSMEVSNTNYGQYSGNLPILIEECK